ncbi:AsmA family protein [Roseiarcaceae bacterium H3SJ34-1]|uniref:AsmA family protein n=1 Tax=Terripilifer ovatus TaxID=3032367 RepID=UPI003AB9A44A|nr:AsmA family protein [Roseiarcaceae bacterium H3SJ34-1]
MNSKLKWATGIGLTVAAIAAFFPFHIFEAALNDQFSAQILQKTGLESHIGGRIALSLLPRPRARLEDVTVRNSAGSVVFQTPFMKADLRILPLIAGRFELEALTLIGPQLTVTADSEGAGTTSPTPSAAQISELAKFGVLTIAGGQLAWQAKGEAPRVIVSEIDGIFDPRNLPAQLSFVGSTVWNGERGSIEALVGKPRQFLERGVSPATLKIVSRIADVTFDGTVQGGAKWQLDGHIAGASSRPREAMQKLRFNPAIPGELAKAAVSGTLKMTQQSLAISDVNLALDKNNFRGSLALRFDGKRPLLSATLASPSLAYTAEQGVTLPLRNDRQWSREPLPLSALALVDMDLRLSAQKAQLGRLALSSAGMAILVTDGKLDMSLGAAQAYGGRVKGQFVLTPVVDGRDLKGNLSFTNVDMGAFLRDVSRTPRITGTASGEISLQSSGDTVAQHAETVDGKLRITVKNGELAGIDAEQALRRSEKRPLSVPAEVRIGSTSFQSAEVAADISNGIVALDKGHISGYGVGLDVGGSFNLPEQSLRLDIGVSPARRPEAMPNASKGSILNFNLNGPWDNPNFILDTDSLIRRSEAAAALLGAQIKPPAPPEPLPAAISPDAAGASAD